uniref:Rubicon Homology domain-containing protein n=1 Tax=Neogobius melanostomus TaxID=47308 RepID=A0A8C6S6E2_9GOBI
MAQVHKLRQKLRFLGEYLLTCRSNAWKKLQARMGPRPYLLESSQLYSIKDLQQIAEGNYHMYLIALVQHASNHVFQCDLCTQRGFICQTCHSNEIIFPFQFDSTTRCKDCKAVFHLHCKSPVIHVRAVCESGNTKRETCETKNRLQYHTFPTRGRRCDREKHFISKW